LSAASPRPAPPTSAATPTISSQLYPLRFILMIAPLVRAPGCRAGTS
jgi:hypothetical protein